MTKAVTLREMSPDQLSFALKETQESLFRLRFQSATERLDTPSNLRQKRREIARIKTIQHERELKEAGEKAKS
jgi:large subunit ribosomal protein L29